MEYRISICSPSNPELTGKFQFKIAEDITKGVWKETTNVDLLRRRWCMNNSKSS